MSGFILVVEDEPKLSTLLEDYLRASGFQAATVADGREVMPAVEATFRILAGWCCIVRTASRMSTIIAITLIVYVRTTFSVVVSSSALGSA